MHLVQIVKLVITFTMLVGICSCTNRHVLRPFTTDECSCTPEGPKEQPKLWLHCCLAHDSAYWHGGSFKDKRNADAELNRCLASVGFERKGRIWYRGLLVTGSAWLPMPWRWGYGWKYPRSYRVLQKLNKASADSGTKKQ